MNEINDIDAFKKEIGVSDRITVVAYGAPYCPPCKAIAPVLEELAKEYPKHYFIKVDINKGEQIAENQSIEILPSFEFFKGGQKVDEHFGDSERKLREM